MVCYADAQLITWFNKRQPRGIQSVSERRLGTESSKTRQALLEAAEQVMREEGYAAVTSRRVAERATKRLDKRAPSLFKTREYA